MIKVVPWISFLWSSQSTVPTVLVLRSTFSQRVRTKKRERALLSSDSSSPVPRHRTTVCASVRLQTKHTGDSKKSPRKNLVTSRHPSTIPYLNCEERNSPGRPRRLKPPGPLACGIARVAVSPSPSSSSRPCIPLRVAPLGRSHTHNSVLSPKITEMTIVRVFGHHVHNTDSGYEQIRRLLL